VVGREVPRVRLRGFVRPGAVENVGKETQVRKLIYRLHWDEGGAALVEYGMLVGLIAVVCLVAVTTLGTEISAAFSKYVVGLAGI